MSFGGQKYPKNCGCGLPDMPGGQGPGRRGLQTSDYGRRASGTGPLSGLKEGPNGGVTGCPPPNPERRIKRGERDRRMTR